MRKWLKDRRIKMNLTQKEVAKKCNISRSYYALIENGTKTPTVRVAKRIAHVLDFKWTVFFESACSFKGQRDFMKDNNFVTLLSNICIY